MLHHPLKVLIVGAGTGGLCLAQGLAADHIDVEVFERDKTPVDRQQGYRLSLSATGNQALRACLPDPPLRQAARERRPAKPRRDVPRSSLAALARHRLAPIRSERHRARDASKPPCATTPPG